MVGYVVFLCSFWSEQLTFLGCLDETTTSRSTSTSISTSTTEMSTTSCVKYGWFGGCVETTTLSPTATPTKAKPALTTSCVEYGWLGRCREATTMPLIATPKSITHARAPTVTTTRPLTGVNPITPMTAGGTSTWASCGCSGNTSRRSIFIITSLACYLGPLLKWNLVDVREELYLLILAFCTVWGIAFLAYWTASGV